MGYEGSTCGTLSRNKILGNWIARAVGSPVDANQYPVSVRAGASVTQIAIANFYNLFIVPVSAGFISPTALHIPTQVINGYTVSGTISETSSTSFQVNYALTDPAGNLSSHNDTWGN